MPKRIAIWNPTRGLWEHPDGAIDLLSEHSEPFWEIWPSSGTTRNGEAFALPTPAPRTDASASSSSPTPPVLPTPGAADEQGNARAHKGGNPTLTGAVVGFRQGDVERHGWEPTPLLGTPRNADGSKAKLVERADARSRLEDQVALLKTPNANLATNGGSQHPDRRKAGGHGPTLADEVEHLLLPTPTAMDSEASGGSTPSNRTLTDATARTSLGARMNPRFAVGKP